MLQLYRKRRLREDKSIRSMVYAIQRRTDKPGGLTQVSKPIIVLKHNKIIMWTGDGSPKKIGA